MLKELEDFGLSEKEARVYLAALEIGRATADQLAKHAKIVRSTTYVQLDSLMQKGLMSTYEEGKKTYFAPESPEMLQRLIAKQKDDLALKERDLGNFLPDLVRHFESAGERPVVRFFTGKEGITAMREETLILNKDEEVLIIYSLDALEGIYSYDELREYTQKRSKKGIRIRSIYTKKDGQLAKEDITPLASRRFISYQQMPITSDFFIFRDKVAIMALQGNIFGTIIESKQIADSFRIFFSLLWGIGAEDK
ncbi:MAG: TrmB family transcriptional regulator [Minisyncoccia bacterium]